jgi:hypothetical protein
MPLSWFGYVIHFFISNFQPVRWFDGIMPNSGVEFGIWWKSTASERDTDLFTLLRAALWRKIELWDLPGFCGNASGHFRYLPTPQNAHIKSAL